MSPTGETIAATDAIAAPVIADLHAAARRPTDDTWDTAAMTEILGMPEVAVRVASIGEEPAGFVIVRVADDECEILMIGVVPDFRRGGIGRRLLESALHAARRSGAARAYLEVAEDNGPGRAFYDRLGFAAVGRRQGYYWRAGSRVDALVLARDLVA